MAAVPVSSPLVGMDDTTRVRFYSFLTGMVAAHKIAFIELEGRSADLATLSDCSVKLFEDVNRCWEMDDSNDFGEALGCYVKLFSPYNFEHSGKLPNDYRKMVEDLMSELASFLKGMEAKRSSSLGNKGTCEAASGSPLVFDDEETLEGKMKGWRVGYKEGWKEGAKRGRLAGRDGQDENKKAEPDSDGLPMCSEEWLAGWSEGWEDGWNEGWLQGTEEANASEKAGTAWKAGWTEGWTGGWTGRWTGGWLERSKVDGLKETGLETKADNGSLQHSLGPGGEVQSTLLQRQGINVQHSGTSVLDPNHTQVSSNIHPKPKGIENRESSGNRPKPKQDCQTRPLGTNVSQSWIGADALSETWTSQSGASIYTPSVSSGGETIGTLRGLPDNHAAEVLGDQPAIDPKTSTIRSRMATDGHIQSWMSHF